MGALCLARKALLACGKVEEKVEGAPIAFTVTAVAGLGWMAFGPMVLIVILKMPHLAKVFHPTSRSVKGLFSVTKAWMLFQELSMLTLKSAVPMMGMRSPEMLNIL